MSRHRLVFRRHHLPDARSAGPHRRWHAPAPPRPASRPRARARRRQARRDRAACLDATAAGRCDERSFARSQRRKWRSGSCSSRGGGESRRVPLTIKGANELTGLLARPLHGDGEQGRLRRLFVRAQTRPTDAGKPIDIVDGQTVEKIDSPATRGVITGHVVGRIWQPCSNVQVAGLRLSSCRDIAA